MKKLTLSLFVLSILLIGSASALFPSGRDLMRLQLLYRSPDAGPIYFRGGLISNIYGDLPAKYSPQDGQIYFPHYFTPYGDSSYRPSDYIMYGSAYGNAGFAGYYPEQNYGLYNYNWGQYAQQYGQQAGYQYGMSYPSLGGYGGYPYGYGGYGYGSGYQNGGYTNYNYGDFGGSQYGNDIYTGYGNNIYPGPFGVG